MTLAFFLAASGAAGCSEPIRGTDASPRNDAAVDAPLGESDVGPCAAADLCTPSSGSAADEDCDGAIDEGCPVATGSAHMVVDLLRPSGWHNTPTLSTDGLRLYFVEFDPFVAGVGTLTVATRATASARFTTIDAVPLPAPTGLVIAQCSIDATELTLVCAAFDRPTALEGTLWVATRATRAGTFGSLTPLSALDDSGASEEYPSISPDGLELVYTSLRGGVREVRRAVRGTPGGAFSAAPSPAFDAPSPPTHMTFGSDGNLAVVRFAATMGLLVARRAEPTSATFAVEGPLDIGAAGGCARAGFLSVHTRELLFGSCFGAEPITLWLGRAEVCRDGPCPDRSIACPGGATTADGCHCFRIEPTATWSSASAACAGAGGHLATIHSANEQAVAWSATMAVGMPAWIGATDAGTEGVWRWETGEPWVAPRWATSIGQPDNAGGSQDVALLYVAPDGAWADDSAGAMYPAVCETEIWPTWLP